MRKPLLVVVFALVATLGLTVIAAADPPLPPNSTLATTSRDSTFSPQAPPRYDVESRVVRVGWFDISGIFEYRNGAMTGYVAGLLQALSQYTGWRYEWVYVNFRDIPRLLDEGLIDMSCGVSYLPSRTSLYAYSRLPAGYETVTLHALKDSPIYYMDLAKFNGMRVGLVRNSYGGHMLDRFAEQNGIVFDKREFSSKKDIFKALERKELDAYMDGSLYGEGMKVIGVIALEPFFFVTRKDDDALLNQLDNAMRQLQIASPRFYANLSEDYLRGKHVSFSLTREEHEWLESKPRLRVAYSERQIMMNTEKGGSNFLVELLSVISRRSGIAFDYVPAPSYAEALAMVSRGEADILSDVYAGLDFLAQNNLMATKAYHAPPILLSGLQKLVPGTGIRVGATREMLSVGAAYLAAYPADQVLYFGSADECEDAYNRNLIHAYIPRYPGMAVYTGEMQSMPLVTRSRYSMALGLSRDVSPLALSILDKTISTLTASEVDALQMSRTEPSIMELLARAPSANTPRFSSCWWPPRSPC